MDKSLVIGILIGMGGAMAGGALASYAVWNVEKQPQTQKAAERAPLPSAQQQTAQLLEAPASYQAPALSAAAAPQAFATVLAVDPVTVSKRYPKQQCRYEQVVHRKPVHDQHRVAGTVIGGALGGVLGHQIGKGRGRDIATVAGAIAGGYAGNRVQKNMQESRTYTTSERRCSTVTRRSKKTVGYDVTYRWNGEVNTVRMTKRPGDRLLVQNGEVLPVGAQTLARYD